MQLLPCDTDQFYNVYISFSFFLNDLSIDILNNMPDHDVRNYLISMLSSEVKNLKITKINMYTISWNYGIFYQERVKSILLHKYNHNLKNFRKLHIYNSKLELSCS